MAKGLHNLAYQKFENIYTIFPNYMQKVQLILQRETKRRTQHLQWLLERSSNSTNKNFSIFHLVS